MINSFEEILQEYYAIKMFSGEEDALKWLDEALRSEDGIEAVKELVILGVKEAEKLLQTDDNIIEFKKRQDH